MLILGIESSCDETSCALVRDGREVLSNEIYTQIPIHLEYGGVVPEIASRNHLIKISDVVDNALEKAVVTFDDVDAIAVTRGPGLVGALLVGVNYAKALSYALKKPLIGVNHLKGHLLSPLLSYPELEPPYIALVVSGGNSYLAICHDYDEIEVLGKSRDDALGEAYDKVARTLGFEYPGGPKIDAAAKLGNGKAIDFPRVYLESGSLDFSFSGIKTAVLNYINSEKQRIKNAFLVSNKALVESRNLKQDLETELNKNDIAASFQEAVLEVLVNKSMLACKKYENKKLVVSGGVAANSRLRELFSIEAEKDGVEVYYPEFQYCTDNAAMIASAAYYVDKLEKEEALRLNANPALGL